MNMSGLGKRGSPQSIKQTLLHSPLFPRTSNNLRSYSSRPSNRAAFGTKQLIAPQRLSNLPRHSAVCAGTVPWRLAESSTPSSAYATMAGPMHPDEPVVQHVFEPVTGSWQYIVADPATCKAVIIDPVLDYDGARHELSTASADHLMGIVQRLGYKVDMILETHAHADHLTAASYLKAMLVEKLQQAPQIGVGRRITQVQSLFGQRYGIDPEEYRDVFDKLWEDDEEFAVGSLTAQAIHLPGHTPDHMGYKIGSNVFVGDSIFHADLGSARADFPGGSAKDIFRSGRRLLSLPDETKIWSGHDYPPPGRDAPVPYMTVRQQRDANKHLKDGTQEDEFVDMRSKRDDTLSEPRLLHPSLQINIRAGRLPPPNAAGHRLLHLPLVLPASVQQW